MKNRQSIKQNEGFFQILKSKVTLPPKTGNKTG